MQEGDKLGKLTLIKIVEVKKYLRSSTNVWQCKCDCGNICTRTESQLNKDIYCHSCGCVTRKNLTPKDSEHMRMCGKARAEKRNKDGCNVDMLFRDKPIVTNTSGAQGISWASNCSKWHAYVGYKGKRYNLGYYEDFELAKSIRATALEQIKKELFEDYYEEIKCQNQNQRKIKQNSQTKR